MPICEMCGEEEDIVTKCKTCGMQFCEFCGSVDDKQCIECLDNSDDDNDDDEDSD
jgi:hypothetical protein